MPIYSISAPDGKTYQIEGPAGASQEQVQAEVLRQNPTAGMPPASSGQFGETGGGAALGRPINRGQLNVLQEPRPLESALAGATKSALIEPVLGATQLATGGKVGSQAAQRYAEEAKPFSNYRKGWIQNNKKFGLGADERKQDGESKFEKPTATAKKNRHGKQAFHIATLKDRAGNTVIMATSPEEAKAEWERKYGMTGDRIIKVMTAPEANIGESMTTTLKTTFEGLEDTIAGLLDQVAKQSNGQNYEEILVRDFLDARAGHDKQLLVKYHNLILNKVMNSLAKIEVTDSADAIAAKQAAFAEALAKLTGIQQE